MGACLHFDFVPKLPFKMGDFLALNYMYVYVFLEDSFSTIRKFSNNLTRILNTYYLLLPTSPLRQRP